MPKITCICGEIINLSQIPNQQGFKIISEQALETLADNLVDAHKNSTAPIEFEKQLYKNLDTKNSGIAQAYECPNCERLIIFGNASDSQPELWFQIEKAHREKTDSAKSLINQVAGTQFD